jgi:hypothetical protein
MLSVSLTCVNIRMQHVWFLRVIILAHRAVPVWRHFLACGHKQHYLYAKQYSFVHPCTNNFIKEGKNPTFRGTWCSITVSKEAGQCRPAHRSHLSLSLWGGPTRWTLTDVWSTAPPRLIFNHSWFAYQSSLTLTSSDILWPSKRNVTRKWPLNFAYEVSLLYSWDFLTCRKILLHGTDGSTSPPK